MADPGTIAPRVARIHYDGQANLFRLKLTALLETPAGNFPFETVITDADLLNVVQAILEEWVLNTSHSHDTLRYTFSTGDKHAFIAWCEINLP